MKIVITLSILFLTTCKAWSCCAEKIERIFPLGISNDKIVALELQLFRTCMNPQDKTIKDEGSWLSGTATLVYLSNSKVDTIEVLDSLTLKELEEPFSRNIEQSQFEAHFSYIYQKALKKAQQLPHFSAIKPQKITFNDTLNVSIVADTLKDYNNYLLTYKDLFGLRTDLNIASCIANKIAETRIYESPTHRVFIFRLRCEYTNLREVKRNKRRFQNIKTAYWREMPQWHGFAKDFVVISEID